MQQSDNLSTIIVFIHALTGDRERTWTASVASEPWPKTLLPSTLPTARILTFGYDAYVADWRGVVSQSRIGDHAWNLLTSLASYRENDDTVGGGSSMSVWLTALTSHRMNGPSFSSATAWEAWFAKMYVVGIGMISGY